MAKTAEFYEKVVTMMQKHYDEHKNSNDTEIIRITKYRLEKAKEKLKIN